MIQILGLIESNLMNQILELLDFLTLLLHNDLNNYDVKINDIITKINNTVIKDSDDFTKIMKKAKNNSYVNLLIYRQSSPLFIALKISK